MPIVRKTFNDGHDIVTICSGHITRDEVFDHMNWLIDNHGTHIKDSYHQLLDALSVTKLDLTEDDVRRVSQFNSIYGQNRGKIQTAIVAVDTSARKLAQLHKNISRAANKEVQIFSTVEQAISWLKIPVEHVNKTKELLRD